MTLIFPIFREYEERCKVYIESIGIYCRNIESIESIEVTTLESNALRTFRRFIQRIFRDKDKNWNRQYFIILQFDQIYFVQLIYCFYDNDDKLNDNKYF